MKSIIVFIPYFGKLPYFYNTWKISALQNHSIDFLLLTDDPTASSEKNIHVVNMTWDEMVRKIQAVYPFKLALKKSYKLCDFRPALGEIFSEYIQKYDFWGYCDLDLVFGNLRTFLTDAVLQSHERIFYNGHISLYKNCDRINSLYRFHEGVYPAVDYEECFTNPRSFYFDEFGGMYLKCLLNQIPVFDNLDIRRDPLIMQRKFYWQGTDESSQFVILWENGTLYAIHKSQKTELVYAHFFRRSFVLPELPEKVEKIVIGPGFVRYNTGVRLTDFQKEEALHYARQYRINAIKGTLKRNGVLGTIAKRKRDRDYWAYRIKIENQTRSNY